MEDLIKQAFLQVDELGPHVQEGRYDLTGPDGEIILPSVWEKVIQPDWQITMTMWPIEKLPQPGPPRPPFMAPNGKHGHGRPPFSMPTHIGGRKPPFGPGAGDRPGGVKIPPAPPQWGGAGGGRRSFVIPDNIDVIDAEPRDRKKEKRASGMSAFFMGSSGKKSSSKKKYVTTPHAIGIRS